LNTGSGCSVWCLTAAKEWSEAHRRNLKLYWLGHLCSEPIRLA
jgi:hypothetical protein